jgi:hypothetical protein
MTDAQWLVDFDARTKEVIDAKAEVALEASPRVWPISGDAEEWNPDGHPLSKQIASDPFAKANKIEDERTGELPKYNT